MFGRAKVRFVETISVDKQDLLELFDNKKNNLLPVVENLLKKYGITENEFSEYIKTEEGYTKIR